MNCAINTDVVVWCHDCNYMRCKKKKIKKKNKKIKLNKF